MENVDLNLFVAGILNVISDGLQHEIHNEVTGESHRIYRCQNGDVVLGDERIPANKVFSKLITNFEFADSGAK